MRFQKQEIETTRLEQLEKALRESEQRLSQIIQGSAIPTFVIDGEHRLIFWNRACEKLTGISAREVIGSRKQWAAFYPSQRPVMADLIADRMSEGDFARYYAGKYRPSRVIEGAYEAEDFFPNLGENGRWLFFTAAPLLDAHGNVTGAIETLQDITERKRAEEAIGRSERRYRTLLDFVPYPVVVFTMDGRVTYLNPTFTQTFGWTLQELEGNRIPYLPPGLEEETREKVKRLMEEKVLLRYETRRMTKDGRVLDVLMRAALFAEFENQPAGELVILRDITEEKRIARDNAALLRISIALPEHTELESLLDYISREVKQLIGTEGALVTLLDEERQELFFPGVAYDDKATQKRVKDIRFSMDELVAGQVIRTGKPLIYEVENHPMDLKRDRILGYRTRNLLEVPIRSSDRIIGVLAAINKKEGSFHSVDAELLSMIAGNIGLSIENARFAEELKTAYKEVTSLNKAKDKAIHHLSHELKTPVSVLSGSLNILMKRLRSLPEDTWKSALDRVRRNLDRILEIQDQVDDIMRGRDMKSRDLLTVLQGRTRKARDLVSLVVELCVDQVEELLEENQEGEALVENLRKRLLEMFHPKEFEARKIHLHEFVRNRLAYLAPLHSKRKMEILRHLENTPPILIPQDPLEKVFDGIVKNAVENTPDEGRIEIWVRKKGPGVELVVRDYGTGIPEESRKRIFDGFFTTRDTMDYSSKRPFDFNAGGKGADLLRAKVFSQRYGFTIDMESTRCPVIPGETDVCPGRIGACEACASPQDCYATGGTTFSLYFPPASDQDPPQGGQ